MKEIIKYAPNSKVNVIFLSIQDPTWLMH